MPLSPVVIDNFGGLDYRQDRVGGGGVVLAHNVVLEDGGVRRRPSQGQFGSVSTTNTIDSMFADPGSGNLVVGNGSRLDAYSGAAAAIANVATGAATHRFAMIGTATTSLVVAVNGTDAPRTFDGAAFASPAFTGVTPTGAHTVAVTPWDNRAVYANVGANESRVYFSDPGVPTTVGTNNYVDLQPGDGTTILGMTAWRDLLFVFKSNAFFVFYGTSTDSTGGPVFNYRTVRNWGIGSLYNPHGGADGVYFQDFSSGELYRTNGGIPQRVSSPVSALLRTGERVSGSSLFTGSPLTVRNIGGDDRYVYFASNNAPLLTFDSWSDSWTTMDTYNTNPAMTFIGNGSAGSTLYFSNSRAIGTFDWRDTDPSSGTTDAHSSVAIDASWRTGWMDLGPAAVEKELRDTVVHGYGAVGLRWFRDYAASSTASSLTLGTWASSLPGKAHTRRAERGRLYSLGLANSSGAFFEVSRVEPFVREVRGAGEQTA